MPKDTEDTVIDRNSHTRFFLPPSHEPDSNLPSSLIIFFLAPNSVTTFWLSCFRLPFCSLRKDLLNAYSMPCIRQDKNVSNRKTIPAFVSSSMTAIITMLGVPIRVSCSDLMITSNTKKILIIPKGKKISSSGAIAQSVKCLSQKT